MPRAIKKKTVSKIAKPEDEVRGLGLKFREFTDDNKKPLAIVVSAIIVCSAVIFSFFIYKNSQKTKAEALEYAAYKTYYSIHQLQPLARNEQYQKAMDIFKKAYEAKKAPFSLFYIASCYVELNRLDDAIKTFRTLIGEFPDNTIYTPLSYYRIAMANIRKGDRNEALKALDALYNLKSGANKDMALMESGKLLEAMGRPDEARKKYEELIKNFSQSPFAEEAKARSGEKKT